MSLPSDDAIRNFLVRTVHDAEDLALLSRTALKEQLQQHFELDGAARQRLDTEDHYKASIRAWVKEAIDTKDASRTADDKEEIDAVGQSKEGAVEEEEQDSEFSSLEDEEAPAKRKGKQSGSATSKKARTSSSSTSTGRASISRGSTTANPSSEEVTLKKLKGYVLLCGTRKPWKKIFAENGCGKDERELGDDEAAKRRQWKKQIAVVKDILTEIGMTTPYSKAKAEKIKADKELQQELEAIKQAETTERSTTRSRQTQTGPAQADSDAKSDSSAPGPIKTFSNSLAAFAAELNDSD